MSDEAAFSQPIPDSANPYGDYFYYSRTCLATTS